MMLKDNSGRNSAVAGGSRGSGVGPPVFGSNQPGPGAISNSLRRPPALVITML